MRCVSDSERKRTMTCAALLRPCTSSGAPVCASMTRSKAMAFSRKRGDGILERRGRARHQPAAEGQERRAVVRRAAFGRQRADQLGLLVVAVPDDDALVAQIEQRFGALERRVEVGDAGAQLDILGGGAGAFADQEDRREQRGAHDAGEHGELDDLDGADATARPSARRFLRHARQTGDKRTGERGRGEQARERGTPTRFVRPPPVAAGAGDIGIARGRRKRPFPR